MSVAKPEPMGADDPSPSSSSSSGAPEDGSPEAEAPPPSEAGGTTDEPETTGDATPQEPASTGEPDEVGDPGETGEVDDPDELRTWTVRIGAPADQPLPPPPVLDPSEAPPLPPMAPWPSPAEPPGASPTGREPTAVWPALPARPGQEPVPGPVGPESAVPASWLAAESEPSQPEQPAPAPGLVGPDLPESPVPASWLAAESGTDTPLPDPEPPAESPAGAPDAPAPWDWPPEPVASAGWTAAGATSELPQLDPAGAADPFDLPATAAAAPPEPGPEADDEPVLAGGYAEAEAEANAEQEPIPEPEGVPAGLPPAPDDPQAPFWYHQPSEPGERAKQFYAWARRTWTASTTPHADSGEPTEVAYRTHQILVFAAGTGVVVGLATVLLKKATLDWLADPLADQPIWLRAAGPAVGLVVAWAALGLLARRSSPDTTDEYIRTFHTAPHVPFDRGPVLGRTVAGVGTIGYGGALSPEGPALYLGAVIGSTIQRRMARFFSREDAKALMVAGAAAGVAAIFKAPATGALFAVELPYQTDVARRVGLPAMIGAVTGYVTAALIDGTAPLFPIAGSTFDGQDLVGALLVGLLCGIVARGFSLGLARLQAFVARTPLVWRMLGAGALLFGLAYAADAAFDRPLSLGAGYDVIAWAVSPSVSLWLVLLMLGVRLAATMATWGGGGVGGFFLPLVVFGALIGRLLGGGLGFADADLLLVVGMAAFLGAGYRTPLAAVLFVAETTGRAGFVVPALVATAAAQLVVGRTSVSPAQRAGRLGHLERRKQLPISAVLETDVRTVPPDATVQELLAVHLVANRRRAVPVVGEGSAFLGLAVLDEVVHVRRDAWPTTTIDTIAQADAPRGRTTWLVSDALAAMERAGTDMLPIVDGDDRFVGVVTTDDILELDAILDRTAKAR